jgi:D-sedoheptulose 7-phosphate isomerase
MKNRIFSAISDSCAAVQHLQSEEGLDFIYRVSHLLADRFRDGGKLLIAGNGGSMCDAMHFAEELTGQFRHMRPALPAIAFSDPGHLTCTANDHGFEKVFSRGVEAHGRKGDIFVGLSTSGNSPNIIHAVETAERLGLHTVLFLGKGGGKLKGRAHHQLIIDRAVTSDRIQEAHMTAIHIMIEMVEELLFGAP